jgi:hypothetical protein
MMIDSTMNGSGRIGAIFWGPDPIAKLIVSVPPVTFACCIAARSVQVFCVVLHSGSPVSSSPPSAVVFTTNVAAWAPAGASATSASMATRHASRGRIRRGT